VPPISQIATSTSCDSTERIALQISWSLRDNLDGAAQEITARSFLMRIS